MRLIASMTILLVVLGVALTFYQSVGLPPTMSAVFGVSYPTAILGATLVFAVLHAILVLRGRVKVPAHIDFSDSDWGGIARFLGALVLWLTYVALLPTLGFVVASFTVVSASLALLARVGPVKSVLAGLVFVLVFNAIFRYILYVSTPQGPVDVWIDTLVYSVTR